MEILFAAIGILGALSCVGMYAAVSLGHASTERPLFFVVNGCGALLVMIGAWHNFDIGDLGTILQELVWIGLSIAGGRRVWRLERQREVERALAASRRVVHAVQTAAVQKHAEDAEADRRAVPQQRAAS
ncbi:MAG: hypothetical protein K8S25_11185 [Alphaproteobacteria bacterium]|nr:hypothetical protein [Alphaproteobacteria bacterium]